MHRGARKRKRFDGDLASAVEFYTKALARGINATLRCRNYGYPPPLKLRPHTKMVKRKGHKKPEPVTVTPMRKLNREHGLWWCPYCMKLRRFVRRPTFKGSREKHMACEVCGASHRDGTVRKWNPLANELSNRETV